MTKPSRIVKSAWKQAGCPGSLKSFAAQIRSLRRDTLGALSVDSLLLQATGSWFANKAKARKTRPRSSDQTHTVLGWRRGGLL